MRLSVVAVALAVAFGFPFVTAAQVYNYTLSAADPAASLHFDDGAPCSFTTNGTRNYQTLGCHGYHRWILYSRHRRGSFSARDEPSSRNLFELRRHKYSGQLLGLSQNDTGRGAFAWAAHDRFS